MTAEARTTVTETTMIMIMSIRKVTVRTGTTRIALMVITMLNRIMMAKRKIN